MKIACFETHYLIDGQRRTAAIDWYRIISPAQHLKKLTGWVVDIYRNPFNTEGKFHNWKELTNNYDIVYFSYTHSYLALLDILKAAESSGSKVICDFDDNVWELTKKHRGYRNTHLGTRLFHIYYQTARISPFLTTTNMLLKRKLKTISLSKNVEVLPNYIDLNVYKYPKKSKSEPQEIQIVFFGTMTHLPDLEERDFVATLKDIFKTYPQVIFKTIGVPSPFLKKMFGKKYNHIKGNNDFWGWIDLWKKTVCNMDIVVAPLEISSFARCKSPIKFFESAAAKRPFVCTDTNPYRDIITHGKNGFLCKTKKDWYDSLSSLIENKFLRQNIGQNAYNEVKKNWTIQKNIWKYKDYFEKIVYEKK